MAPERPTARLEHAGPTRLRARVVRQERSRATLERVRREIAARPGVHEVRVNGATGSVLVEGPDRDQLHEAVSEALHLVRSFSGEESPDRGVEQVVRLVRTADRRLQAATDGRISLRWLVPAAFVGLGVRQFFQQGFTLGTIPWYVLLYYGADSFLKLYPEHAPASGGGTAAPAD